MRLATMLREIPNDTGLRAGWNALVNKTDEPQVFYTWEWARAVEIAYHSELQPWLAIWREDDEVIGLVALGPGPTGQAVFSRQARQATTATF